MLVGAAFTSWSNSLLLWALLSPMLSVGAQPSETARSLIKKAGIGLPEPKVRKKSKRRSAPKPFVPPRNKKQKGAAAAASEVAAQEQKVAAPEKKAAAQKKS